MADRPKGPPHTSHHPQHHPQHHGGGGGGNNGTPRVGAAAQALIDMFNTYGLTGLADEVIKWAKNGVTGSELLLKVRESDAYKRRFPGMEALDQAGYNAVTEAQYIELEDNYHKALQTAGLPAGFYDSPDDFVKYMRNGIDYTELYDRATAAVDLARQSDPTKRELLSKLYGVNAGDIAAHFLDPNRAKGILEKQIQVVDIAAAARKSGLAVPMDRDRFERLQEAGVTADQAAAGYSQIAASLDTLSGLADVYGTNYDIDTAENAQFFGNKGAQRKQRQLIGQEEAAFSGRAGYVATDDASAGTY